MATTPIAPSSVSRRRRAQPFGFWLLVIVVLAASWALRLYRLDFQDIWWDEARNIDVALRPFLAIAGAPELDIHPPIYFYLLHGWLELAQAVAFTTRLFSAWFGVLVVALAYRLGAGIAGPGAARRVGLLALILAAVSPYALSEAQETRMYTLSWALLSLGMLALWRATERRWDAGGSRIKQWGPFVLLVVATLLTHYATAIILATWAVWLMGWALFSSQRRARLLTLAGVGATTVLLCLPVLPIALRQIPAYDNPNLVLPDLPAYLSQLYRAFTLGDFVSAGTWAAGRWLWLGLVGGGVIVALLRALSGRMSSSARQHIALLVLWLFGSLALFYAVLVARSAFDPRYISFILPPLWALAAWGLAGWGALWRPLPWLAALTLVIVSAPSLRADLTDPARFREDARSLVAYLQRTATPDDIILVDQRYPFGFYWQRWNNDFYGTPPAEPGDEAPAQYLFVDINHIDERLTELAGNARRVFWVTWFESDMDPRGAVRALLDSVGTRVDEQFFRGYTAQVWELDPPVVFRLASAFHPIAARFGPGITLVEGDWAAGDANALVTLRWQADAPSARPLKASVRLKDASGATVAQDDRLLLNDRHLRTTAWQPGETALNVYSLPLPAAPGEYTLSLVVYDEETLEAVGLSDGSGIELPFGSLNVGQ